MKKTRLRALAAALTAGALLALTPALSAPAATQKAAAIAGGSCVVQTAAGVTSAIGSAEVVLPGREGPVAEAVPCSADLIQPLSAYWSVSSAYGVRVHPITGSTSMHYGTDYSGSAIRGTPILSIAKGTVVSAVESYATWGAGNTVVISHPNGVRSQYMHMGAPTTYKVGQTVNAGTVIGYVGTTGGSTGPHLHFEIKVNNVSVDPFAFLAGAPYIR